MTCLLLHKHTAASAQNFVFLCAQELQDSPFMYSHKKFTNAWYSSNCKKCSVPNTLKYPHTQLNSVYSTLLFFAVYPAHLTHQLVCQAHVHVCLYVTQLLCICVHVIRNKMYTEYYSKVNIVIFCKITCLNFRHFQEDDI